MVDDMVVQPEMARLNVTWGGSNGDMPDLVPYDSTDGDLKQMASEAVMVGHIPGIPADRGVAFEDFKVDRFPADVTAGLPARLFLRPKTPFGA